MAKKTYTVVGAFPVLHNRPGSTFSADIDPDQEKFFLDTGQLTIGKDADDATASAKVPCPACVEYGMARPPKFDDVGALVDHYADKHPALVPPDHLPSAAGEEE